MDAGQAEFKSGKRGTIDVPFHIRMAVAMQGESVITGEQDEGFVRVFKRDSTQIIERWLHNKFVKCTDEGHGVIDVPFHIRMMAAMHGDDVVIDKRDGDFFHVSKQDHQHNLSYWVHDMFIKRAK